MRPVPAQFPDGQPWGYDPSYDGNSEHFHYGKDYRCPIGTKGTVRYSGRVVIARDNWPDAPAAALMHNVQPGAWGLYLEIERPNGDHWGYAHHSGILVWEGDWVEAGQGCYLTGDSGLTFGPHLHEQRIVNGQRVDPGLACRLSNS